MNNFNRRDFLKTSIGGFLVASGLNSTTFSVYANETVPLILNASTEPPKVVKNYLKTGTTKNPKGLELTADSRSLLINDEPFLPVMGEFHYSRYPENDWRNEILKMKMGGIDIVATYVFWIHHEEIEGKFDWSGQRNLRKFIELCRELEMPLALRVGPWCHGEVRNGGLPDWILTKGWKVRSDDENYLEKVKILYGEIYKQVEGLFWKDGGNIITVQLENEFKGRAEHMLTLKKYAQEVGMDAPIYTRTGWTNTTTPMPLGEIVPLYGVYAEGFWDREITPMPGDYKTGFMFWLARTNSAIATDQLGSEKRADEKDVYLYPYFCCEIGGGMIPSYHRRILIYPKDVESTSMIKIGSGNNLQGYYMYHGGTNPEGKLSTLHESQETNYWNDMPVKSYDFQAPLGEFGQINPHYHSLRKMHLFLRDFGSSLATMPAYLPEKHSTDPENHTTLRWAARTDGKSGYVFVNNYQRLQRLSPKTNVQFSLKLLDKTLTFPNKPIIVSKDECFFFPFNLDINGAKLVYATAQPVCKIESNGETFVFFSKLPQIEAEFVFADDKINIEKTNGKISKTDGQIQIQNLKTGTNSAIRLQTANKKHINIILLDELKSLSLWKAKLGNREHVFLTNAGLIADGGKLQLSSENKLDLAVSIFPAPANVSVNKTKLKPSSDGIFSRYVALQTPQISLKPTFEKIREADPPREIKNGSKGVAEAPNDADFEKAAVWRIKLPKGIETKNHLLRIGYNGDAARIYLGDKFLTDNFYNGNVFELGLKHFAPDIYQKDLILKILPLRKDAPIYLQDDAKPDFAGKDSICKLISVNLVEIYQTEYSVS